MPRILPEPDMNLYEYVLEVRKDKRLQGQQYRHRVLKRIPEPPAPDPDED